jgi:hypothetical protein
MIYFIDISKEVCDKLKNWGGEELKEKERKWEWENEREDEINEWEWRWPVGYGDQPLYEIVVMLSVFSTHSTHSTHSKVISTARKLTAFRKAELVREKDKTGESFYFKYDIE